MRGRLVVVDRKDATNIAAEAKVPLSLWQSAAADARMRSLGGIFGARGGAGVAIRFRARQTDFPSSRVIDSTMYVERSSLDAAGRVRSPKAARRAALELSTSFRIL